MRITYLNSRRLYTAFLAGGNAIVDDKDYLNKINVFPVPDADTGTNLAATVMSIAQSSVLTASIKGTMRSMADAALMGARGNSGLIFAQFVLGISQEIKNDFKLTTRSFGESVKAAVQHVQKSIVSPREGTMLTVIRDWADAVYHSRTKTHDFIELLSSSLQAARQSLMDTPKKLSVLAKAGVVDAGAKGFVDFIEGILEFIRRGKLRSIAEKAVDWQLPEPNGHSFKNEITHRFCTEAMMTGAGLDIDRLRQHLQAFGESAIIAGSEERVRFHVHTNRPAELFYALKDYGSITQVKVDDMIRQFESIHSRRSPIALVTDTSCDLPQEVIDEHQIHVIPFQLAFGDSLFLDRLTVTPGQFYTLQKTSRAYPQTSQPSASVTQAALSFLASHYESIIMFHISAGLSGTYSGSRQAADKIAGKKISVIDSKGLSLMLGLLVLRSAEALRAGSNHDEIVASAEAWVRKTKIFVDVQTLKYMVRSGRVSPLKGLLARVLNIKPIISLDGEGKSRALGQSFSRRGNMKKILKLIETMKLEGRIWNYGIVHAQNRKRADSYGDELRRLLGREPAFIEEVTPVIGVHVGSGVVAVILMAE